MQHLTFLAIIFLSLTRTGKAMPPRPPPPPPPLPPSPSPYHQIHWLLLGAAASAHAPKPPSEQPVSVLDGVPLGKIPRGLVPAALLREKAKRRGGVESASPVAVSGRAGQLGRRRRRDTTAGPDMNAVAFCRSDDDACIKMMEEYEQWRKDNGYGLVGGRWG